MKCEKCDEGATVHQTKVEHGKLIECHYCEACAKGVIAMPLGRRIRKSSLLRSACDKCGAGDVAVLCTVSTSNQSMDVRVSRQLCAACASAEGIRFEPPPVDCLAVVAPWENAE